MALLPCVEEIEQKFGQLEGITFRGFFIGEHYVEQTDNYLQMIDVEINNGKFAQSVGVILAETYQQYGRLVWTGVTGPETSHNYKTYRFFVPVNAIQNEYGDDMQLQEGVLYKFQIVRVRIYQRKNIAEGRYLCGVNFTLRIVKRY